MFFCGFKFVFFKLLAYKAQKGCFAMLLGKILLQPIKSACNEVDDILCGVLLSFEIFHLVRLRIKSFVSNGVVIYGKIALKLLLIFI